MPAPASVFEIPSLRAPAAAILVAVCVACGPPAEPSDGDQATSSGPEPSTTDVATTLPLPPDPGATATSSPTTTVASSDDGVDSSGVDFLLKPDATHPSTECDIEAQDCPRGFKCMPYSSQGGSWWDSTACFPIDPDPVGLGEPCQWEGMPWSGHDDCGAWQVCWSFEPGDGGVCKGLCMFDEPGDFMPSCEDPAAIPFYGCQECFCMCETQCNPLGDDCPKGQECVPSADIFTCVPDASGDMGAYGDPCEFINVCDPGLACLEPGNTPGCDESNAGCCTPFCDVTQPNACPGAAEGQECLPWYEPGDAPPGLENLGACGLPQ